jgi:lysozyme family protein
MISIPLSEVTSSGEGEEGGFEVEFTIPADTEPGSYSVVATAEDGDATSADLEITAPSEEASSAPAEMVEASGKQHDLDRSKSPIELTGAAAVIVLSAIVGFLLIRSQDR